LYGQNSRNQDILQTLPWGLVYGVIERFAAQFDNGLLRVVVLYGGVEICCTLWLCCPLV